MRSLKYKLALLIVSLTGFACLGVGSAAALSVPSPSFAFFCGESKDKIVTSIDLGCQGKGNPIIDMMFAVIRLLSNGVGLVIIGSIILGGIQYTMSAGDPQAAAKAIGRIRATVIALMIFLFAYPILNYVIPSGFFK